MKHLTVYDLNEGKKQEYKENSYRVELYRENCAFHVKSYKDNKRLYWGVFEYVAPARILFNKLKDEVKDA